MATKRNTYKYHFKRGNKNLHTGITNDLERRGAIPESSAWGEITRLPGCQTASSQSRL